MGNGINWKGQVFPRMRNFTASHKMTGVGNALKRHYQLFLLEYEQVGGWEGGRLLVGGWAGGGWLGAGGACGDAVGRVRGVLLPLLVAVQFLGSVKQRPQPSLPWVLRATTISPSQELLLPPALPAACPPAGSPWGHHRRPLRHLRAG